MKRINTLKPRSFDDVQLAADSLRQQLPVILNFENTAGEDKKRFIDFISGSVKAVKGEMYMISDDVYLCAPTNVSVTKDTDKKSSF